VRADRVEVYVLADDYAGYEVRGLLAQHGLSIYLKVFYKGKVYSVLFDVGQVGKAVIANSELLGVNIKDIDMIVLSHNHYDHSGGLLDVLSYVGNRRIPLVAHPDIVKPSIHIGNEAIRLNIGLPYSIDEVKDRTYTILTKDPLEVAPGTYFLGEIKRNEEYVPEFKGLYTIEDGKLVRHELRDDTGLAVNVDGLGLVVLGGCSHSGIVNIVEQAMRLTKSDVYAVIGGFHLINSSNEFIDRVVRKLRDLGVSKVITGHCTGLRAEYRFLEVFGKNFIKMHTGYHTVLEGK